MDTMIVVDEGVTPTDTPPDVVKVETAEFMVTAEGGIFKGGKHYAQGETAVLEVNAGRRLAANGDVEEVK